MADINKQSQIRAQKLNIGVIQKLERTLKKLEKDQRKRLLTVDQDIIDSRKFLDHVQASTGNAVTYEEAFPSSHNDATRASMIDSSHVQTKPTRSAVIRLEVQLQKALAESRFRDKSKDFFKKWHEVFKMDLDLDSYLLPPEDGDI